MEETRFQKIERFKKQERWGGFYTFCAGVVVAALLVAAIFVPALPVVGAVLSWVSASIGMGGLTPQVVAIVGAVISFFGGLGYSSALRETARGELKSLGYSGQQSYNSYGNEDSGENKNNKVHNEPENKKNVEAGKKETMQKKEVKDEASLGTSQEKAENKKENPLVDAVNNKLKAQNKKQQNNAPD